MILELLPTRTAGAAENMAADFLLLQRYSAARAGSPRFRHYEWRRPAFTFGYAQKIAWVREQLAADTSAEGAELSRRPTGGGLVDHRDDWTYALVIPRGHPLEERPAAQSYRAIHDALVRALCDQDVEAELQPCEACEALEAPSPAGVCFQRAEVFDVVHAMSRAKIAGAAQKRNKHGLLFQGSIARATVGSVDWSAFEEGFQRQLGVALEASPVQMPWSEIDDDELTALTEKYAAPEWLEFR